MLNDDPAGWQQMHDAALVRSARLQINAALAGLATRPLEEDTAAQLQAALGVHAPARAALRRLRADAADTSSCSSKRVPRTLSGTHLAPPQDAA